MPQISVIMPVYQMAENAGILQEAVNSIKQQTYQDWELILCDDGSTDHTWKILKKLARTDVRIRTIRCLNNGKAGRARNICIRASKGRYLAIMDADDIADPKRLEIQIAFLEKHPKYAFVGSFAWMIDNHGVWGLRRIEKKPEKKSFLSALPFVHSSVLLRREAVLAVHGYAQAPYAYRVEDYDFFIRLYIQGYQGYNIQKPLMYYREDIKAYKKRKYRYRILECRMRFWGFWKLGILCGNLRYVVKPLLSGLIPAFLMRAARMRKFRIQQGG